MASVTAPTKAEDHPKMGEVRNPLQEIKKAASDGSLRLGSVLSKNSYVTVYSLVVPGCLDLFSVKMLSTCVVIVYGQCETCDGRGHIPGRLADYECSTCQCSGFAHVLRFDDKKFTLLSPTKETEKIWSTIKTHLVLKRMSCAECEGTGQVVPQYMTKPQTCHTCNGDKLNPIPELHLMGEH